ncbi:hypothetical protein C2E21_3942 [Chlorella sorokiniana]|uniref:Uncharacterized protein n=1 Tax=Chlorella sorokiniana TaxID=3076 RepID=A0A2P6TT35_CHLSO|nr:hypothetical protein C2E21_3942 [Chlorella sorokiniana]|eukprot:PRW57235.1 hypothetical protein C2E21_3942 [Chlorella sorokiniana]
MPEEQQQANFELAQQRLARFSNRTVFLRMFTSEAVKQIQDESLDWVYIDARHDYCGCWEDMLQWWPKLRPNGLFMGHDYITAAGVRQIHPQEDWSLCANGTRHEGAVEGAVRDFAQLHFLTVAVTYAEGHPWKSWMAALQAPC